MRFSKMAFGTLREDPSDSEVSSHRLLSRAGFMRRLASGIYALSPLAVRVLNRMEHVIRDEMDKLGAQEVRLPLLQPSEPWEASGRWDRYGSEMFRLKDRNGRDFCLGPTHEEIITCLIRDEVRSYRQLPVLLYQIANKYRDEVRPRFGLMRSREFLMKDLYSFDVDGAGLDSTYQRVHDAYCSIFSRCGLEFRAAEADSGLIGGNESHEFMVLADTGEVELAVCRECDYTANLETAECILDIGNVSTTESDMPEDGYREVPTPGARSVEEVSGLLGCRREDIIKTLLFTDSSGRLTAALVRGDHSVNPIKLVRELGSGQVELASDTVVQGAVGAPVGFIGPVGLSEDIRIVADHTILTVSKAVVGANKVEAHLIGVVPGMDFRIDAVADIRLAKSGDPCPRCGEAGLDVTKGIEVGHIFKLGTKYSEALGAGYTDADGKNHPMVMGCYGIGVTRVMAAAVEQNHDGYGITWPMSIAPFQVHIVPVNAGDGGLMLAAEGLYKELERAGYEVLLDDRDERPGVKFKDADLIGCPIRVTIGSKTLERGLVEFKFRKEMEPYTVPIGDLVKELGEMIGKGLS